MDEEISYCVTEVLEDLLSTAVELEGGKPRSIGEFSWESYLEATGSVAVEPSAFTHVEKSLDGGIPPNAFVLLRSDLNQINFWPAQFQYVCGKSVKLSFIGADNCALDCWIQLDSFDRDMLKPLKLTDFSREDLCPPASHIDRSSEYSDALKELRESIEDESATTWSPDDNFKESFLPIDRIKVGQYVEVLDGDDPRRIRIAKILGNFSGRLLLRCSNESFWLFWLSERFRFLGWGRTDEAKLYGCSYEPPEADGLIDSLTGPPMSVFCHQIELEEHNFAPKMKLEVLDWTDPTQFRPATVIEVLNDFFFVVEIDRLSSNKPVVKKICHRLSAGIFPTNWCRANGLRLTPPLGYCEPEFQWFSYLRQEDADAAPSSNFNIPKQISKFRKGQMLEVSNPSNSHQICAATVTKVAGHLLWIQLNCYDHPTAPFIVDSRSFELFPCGWSGASCYPLSPPAETFQKTFCHDCPVDLLSQLYSSEIPHFVGDHPLKPYMPPHLFPKRTQPWAPMIYVNHKCYAGPFLCRTRIAEMPRRFGPGPIKVVLPKLMSLLLSTSYRPKHSLLEVQPDCNNPNPARDIVVIKVKYRNKRWRGQIEVCRNGRQVSAYLRHMAILLECCPNLISTNKYSKKCPADCHRLLKTKVIAPLKPIQTAGVKQPRHTRADANMFEQAKILLEEDEDSRDNTECQEGIARRSKRRPSILFRLDSSKKVTTRGVKLPSFAFAPVRIRKRKVSDDSNEAEEKAIGTARDRPVLSEQNLRIDVLLPKVESNPRNWSCGDLLSYVKQTEAAGLVPLLRNEQIDGEAFLLLNLPTVQRHLHLNLGPAIKLCKIVEKLKLAFLQSVMDGNSQERTQRED